MAAPRKREPRAPGSMHEECHPGADVTAEEWEFLKAVEEYRRRKRRRFPSLRELLAILVKLGWRKA